MTEIEALRRHLDERLDAQDAERKQQGRDLGRLQVQVGRLEGTLEERAKSAEKEHDAIKEACAKRHESVSAKIAVRDRYLGLGVVAVVAAAFKLAWDEVTKARS